MCTYLACNKVTICGNYITLLPKNLRYLICYTELSMYYEIIIFYGLTGYPGRGIISL
jgi:hypothetical protein